MSTTISSDKHIKSKNLPNHTSCFLQKMKAQALARKAIREKISLQIVKEKLLQYPCFQKEKQDYCQQITKQSFDIENIFLEAMQKEKNISRSQAELQLKFQ